MSLAPKEEYQESEDEYIPVEAITFTALLSLTLYIPYIMTSVVEEKERRVRQLLRISGLRDSAYW